MTTIPPVGLRRHYGANSPRAAYRLSC
jgi:hypothetical protein